MMMLPQNNELIEYKLTQIQDDIDSLKSDVSSMKDDITKILSALEGNSLAGSKGLSKRIEDVEGLVKDNEDFIKKIKWAGGVVAVVGGLIGWLLNFIFK
mgnify:FL=1